MTGVEVLAVEEIAIGFAFNWSEFWGMAILTFCILLALGCIIAIMENNWIPAIGFCILGLIMGVGLGFVFGHGNGIPIEYENQYKVTISDEVSMNEFIEKYEIIEQEGKIYTVREKE